MRALITDAEFPDLALEEELLTSAGFEVVRAQCRTPAEVLAAGEGATALLVQYAPITAEVIQGLEDLRVVSRYGVGVDNVDLDAAGERGVWVSNVVDYGAEEVAAHACSSALGLVRHLSFQDRAVRGGRWHYLSTGTVRRISDLTLGVVGMGRIGRFVAARIGDWFGRVVGHDPLLPADAWPDGVDALTLDDVFAASNIVTLHLPLSSETRGVVDDRLLGLLPEGSYLVNTARGGLVDVDALLRALDSGRLAGAALDVLPQEPPPENHPVLVHPRVVLTPHVAWYSDASEHEMRRVAALNIAQWRERGEPVHVVVAGDRPADLPAP